MEGTAAGWQSSRSLFAASRYATIRLSPGGAGRGSEDGEAGMIWETWDGRGTLPGRRVKSL